MDDDCPICREPLADRNDRWRPLACEHWFHRACVDRALRADPRCPVCRGEADGIVSFAKREVVSAGAPLAPLMSDRAHRVATCSAWLLTTVIVVIFAIDPLRAVLSILVAIGAVLVGAMGCVCSYCALMDSPPRVAVLHRH